MQEVRVYCSNLKDCISLIKIFFSCIIKEQVVEKLKYKDSICT